MKNTRERSIHGHRVQRGSEAERLMDAYARKLLDLDSLVREAQETLDTAREADGYLYPDGDRR